MKHQIHLKNGFAYIAGRQFPLKTHELLEIAGQGANGVVFKARHKFLNRIEAVKLWLAAPNDIRDKVKQGIYETQNQAAAAHEQVIKILNADVIDGIYCASMDYFDGGNLRNWIKDADSAFKWRAADAYLQLIADTSTPNLYHGDPHAGNVLIGDGGHLALCDYGTSYYSKTEESWARHWRIVDEVMRHLLSHFATFNLARTQHPAMFPTSSYKKMLQDYSDVIGVLGAEIYMFSDGIEHLHDDQKRVLLPLWDAKKNADGTGAYEITPHVKRIVARARAKNSQSRDG